MTLSDVIEGHADRLITSIGVLVRNQSDRAIVRFATAHLKDPQSEVASALRRASTALKARAPQVLVEWAAPFNVEPGSAAAAWPGDDAVDIVGIDLNPGVKWVDTLGKLDAWSDWATAHGKRLAVHWAIDGGTSLPSIQAMRQWLGVMAAKGRLAYEVVAIADTRANAVETYRQLF